MTAPRPLDDTERVAALARLELLDTEPEERFDRITRIAAAALDAPIALVSLVDLDRQWFKSAIGVPMRETTRDISFCGHAVAEPSGRLIVPEAISDIRFRDSPLVTGPTDVQAYAGYVIRAPDGHPVGTLCVMDHRPRHFDERQLEVLAELATLVETELCRVDEIELLAQLDEAERTKSLLLDALEEGMLLFDRAGRVIQANRRAAEILGVPATQLHGGSLRESPWTTVRVDGSEWPVEQHPVLVVLRTGTELSDQTLGFDRGHERRWLHLSARPVAGQHGEIASVVAVFSDITDELEERASTAALTERLRVAIDLSPIGTALVDRFGRFTYLNQAYADLLGLSPSQALGREATEWVHPDDAERAADELASLVEGSRASIAFELQVRDERGDTRQVLIDAARLSPSTPGAAFLVHVDDVTTQRELEAALRRSEETASTSLAALDQGVIVLDGERRLRLMNPAAQMMLGTDTAEIAARLAGHGPPVTTEDGRPIPLGERAVDIALVERQPVRRRIVRWLRGDGREVLFRLSAAPVELAGGEAGAMVAFTDITERRALERDLELFGILFEHANDLTTVFAADGRLRYASPSNVRILGHHVMPDDLDGVLRLVHPDELDEARMALEELRNGTRTDEPFTVRLRDAAGEWRSLECIGVNLLDDDAVRGLVITARDVTERQRLLEQLAHRATHDLLTDLPNRSVLGDQLTGALARSERTGVRIGLCYLDLDDFKQVNDTLGHLAGDELLIEVAERIRSAIRAGDVPARIGGDEFVVVLDPVSGGEDARRAAERIRDAVLASEPPICPEVGWGVSVGVAVSRPGDDADQLVARADAALYRSKEARDRSVVLAPD